MADVEENVTDAASSPSKKAVSEITEKKTASEIKNVAKSTEQMDDKPLETGNGDAGNGDIIGNDSITKEESQIIRQIEYYFGDANLNRDKFLLEQISKDEGGWVPFSVLLTFKRLSAITTDVDAIVAALHKSDEGLIEISEDKLKIRRHPERPIPEHNEERRKEIMSRTVYVKGFPLETELSELIDYFAPYEKVANITMRKWLDKATKTYKFKGSIFVTFLKREQTEEFINKEKVQFKEQDLIRKWQETYLEEKREERTSQKKSKVKPVEEDKFQLAKGCVLYFEGATEKVTREMIREATDKIDGDWEVAYVGYNKGEKVGHIRLAVENSATGFIEKLEDKKLKLAEDIELTLRVLEGEEEKAFLTKAMEQMKLRRNQGGRHRGGHFHGHNNRKRRSGGANNDASDAKKSKSDD